jgi:hypothetical protein
MIMICISVGVWYWCGIEKGLVLGFTAYPCNRPMYIDMCTRRVERVLKLDQLVTTALVSRVRKFSVAMSDKTSGLAPDDAL